MIASDNAASGVDLWRMKSVILMSKLVRVPPVLVSKIKTLVISDNQG